MLSQDKLVEIARSLFARNTKQHIEEAAKFKKVSFHEAVVIVLENTEERKRYEIILEADTGTFLHSRYVSPSTSPRKPPSNG